MEPYQKKRRKTKEQDKTMNYNAMLYQKRMHEILLFQKLPNSNKKTNLVLKKIKQTSRPMKKIEEPNVHTCNFYQFIFTKIPKTKYGEKENIFNKWSFKNELSTCSRMISELYLSTCT